MELLLIPLLMVSYYFLNRLRGTLGPGGVVVGGLTGLIVGIVSLDVYWAVATAIAYTAGESIGWGRWLATVPYWGKDLTWEEYEKIRQPDRGDLIHNISNKICPEKKNWKKYCICSLSVRGLVWWLPIALVALAFGHSNPAVGASVAILGATMPVWYHLGFKMKGQKGYWKQGEHLYGVIHGLSIGLLLV